MVDMTYQPVLAMPTDGDAVTLDGPTNCSYGRKWSWVTMWVSASCAWSSQGEELFPRLLHAPRVREYVRVPSLPGNEWFSEGGIVVAVCDLAIARPLTPE